MSQDNSEIVQQADEQEVNIDDRLILFLDAASDSNFENLKTTYEKCGSSTEQVLLLTHRDGDDNTALHFGAKNGNFQICHYLITELKSHGKAADVINSPNSKGFSPLIEVAFRGY